MRALSPADQPQASRKVRCPLFFPFLPFLRRHLGPDYLPLLQFFLNHRRYLRREHPQRVDRSPAELLTGQGHAHWLELLGLPDPLRN